MSYWIDMVMKGTSVLLTVVLGCFGAYIAYQQYHLNRDKTRLDLFDKRFAAYEKLQEYFNLLLQEGRATNEAIRILSEARYKSLFLFNEDITEHIEEVWGKAFEIRRLNDRLYGPTPLPVGNERSEVSADESTLLKWNVDQQLSSPKRFCNYLKFL